MINPAIRACYNIWETLVDNKSLLDIIIKINKGAHVTKVLVGQNENLDKALRRLKKKIEREGILKILKQRKHYEKPSEIKRREKRNSAKKKAQAKF